MAQEAVEAPEVLPLAPALPALLEHVLALNPNVQRLAAPNREFCRYS